MIVVTSRKNLIFGPWATYIYIYKTSYFLFPSFFLFFPPTISRENRSEVKRGIKFEESSPSSSCRATASRSIPPRGLFDKRTNRGVRRQRKHAALLEERQYACKEHLDPLLRLERPFRTRLMAIRLMETIFEATRVSGKLSPCLGQPGNFVIISPPSAVNTV